MALSVATRPADLESHEFGADAALHAADLQRSAGFHWCLWLFFNAKINPIRWKDQLWNIHLSLAGTVDDHVQGFHVVKRVAMVHPAFCGVARSDRSNGGPFLALL
jgi:hypothetical protein